MSGKAQAETCPFSLAVPRRTKPNLAPPCLATPSLATPRRAGPNPALRCQAEPRLAMTCRAQPSNATPRQAKPLLNGKGTRRCPFSLALPRHAWPNPTEPYRA